MATWKDKTLEELESDYWDTTEYESSLITRCHELRKKRLRDFSIEDLRIMIGQEMGLEYLIPIAIERLKENILSEGDFYPGDLLQTVARINVDFWKEHDSLRNQLNLLIIENKTKIEEKKIDISTILLSS